MFTGPAIPALLSGCAVVGASAARYNTRSTVNAEWIQEPSSPFDPVGSEKILKDVPQYVLDYAPLVHLYSKEPFWPGLMDEHLNHTTPFLGDVKTDESQWHFGLDQLAKLNLHLPPWWLYLTSNDHVKNDHPLDFPDWLIGGKNIPQDIPEHGADGDDDGNKMKPDPDDDWSEWFDVGAPDEKRKIEEGNDENMRFELGASSVSSTGNLNNVTGKSGGKSGSPVVLIVVEKDNGVVDAFWFYFYHYNLGNSVFSIRFGNHVGDWEHNMIRFHNGVPKAVFFSEHAGGSSYTYEAVEKIGKRPRVYSASGTHAMYATSGLHPYVLPFKILRDTTDRGPLWDPLRNLYAYHYNTTLAGDVDRSIWSMNGENIASAFRDLPKIGVEPETFTVSSLTPDVPTSWLYFRGHWGDKNFNKSDPRQYQVFGEKAYVSGPMGPRWKALGRRMVCPSYLACHLKTSVKPMWWGWRLCIDLLKCAAIVTLVVGIVWGIIWAIRACVYCGRQSRRVVHRVRTRKVEGDEEDVLIIVEDEPDETTSLLRNERITVVPGAVEGTEQAVIS